MTITGDKDNGGAGGPSKLHNDLARLVGAWVGSRATGKGIRGAREVQVGKGYVADAVFMASLQSRHTITYNPKALSPHGGSICLDDYVLVFESKVSRADFLGTYGPGRFIERATPVGNLHFVVTPKGLVKPDEVPSFWGLLETSGTGLRQMKAPTFTDLSEADLHRMAHRLLWKKNYHRDFVWSGTTDPVDGDNRDGHL